MSPLASVKACLQSIIGAPVISRRSFTCAAEIFTVVVPMRFLLRKDVACYVFSSHTMICRDGQETLQATSLQKQRPATGRSLVKTRAGQNSTARVFTGN